MPTCPTTQSRVGGRKTNSRFLRCQISYIAINHLTTYYMNNMNENLAHELLEMAQADQDYRKGWFENKDKIEYQEGLKRLDNGHLARLQQIISTYGWPSRKLVGGAASHGAWLLVQHSTLELQKKCLELITQLSPDENDPRQRAYLTDRVRMREDKPQIYGTQYHRQGEDLVLYDVEDSAHLDERRATVGLGPANYTYDFEAAKKADEEGTAFSSLGGWRQEPRQ